MGRDFLRDSCEIRRVQFLWTSEAFSSAFGTACEVKKRKTDHFERRTWKREINESARGASCIVVLSVFNKKRLAKFCFDCSFGKAPDLQSTRLRRQERKTVETEGHLVTSFVTAAVVRHRVCVNEELKGKRADDVTAVWSLFV